MFLAKVKVIGHRGSKGTLPENSLAGFQKTLEVGADGIELDVHRTKDGKIVVMHDETINRTTNGRGLIKEMTLHELQKYHLKNMDGTISEEKIPTLNEVLDLVKMYPEAIVNIELKMHRVYYPGLEEEVLKLVAAHKLTNQIIYSSFHLPTVVRLKNIDPNTQVSLLIQQPIPHLFDYVQLFQLDGINPSKKLYETERELFHDCGKIRLWKVNEEKDIRESLMWEIDSIITDFPEKAVAIRDQKGKRKYRFPTMRS